MGARTTTTFLLVELVGAYWSKSLALLSDAAHMLTDVAALAISLVALRVGKRSADHKRTFGYAPTEILAAAFNAALLFLVALYISTGDTPDGHSHPHAGRAS